MNFWNFQFCCHPKFHILSKIAILKFRTAIKWKKRKFQRFPHTFLYQLEIYIYEQIWLNLTCSFLQISRFMLKYECIIPLQATYGKPNYNKMTQSNIQKTNNYKSIGQTKSQSKAFETVSNSLNDCGHLYLWQRDPRMQITLDQIKLRETYDPILKRRKMVLQHLSKWTKYKFFWQDPPTWYHQKLVSISNSSF